MKVLALRKSGMNLIALLALIFGILLNGFSIYLSKEKQTYITLMIVIGSILLAIAIVIFILYNLTPKEPIVLLNDNEIKFGRKHVFKLSDIEDVSYRRDSSKNNNKTSGSVIVRINGKVYRVMFVVDCVAVYKELFLLMYLKKHKIDEFKFMKENLDNYKNS